MANRKAKRTDAGQKPQEPKQEKLTAAELANLRDRGKAFDPTATKMDVVEDLRRVQEEHPNKSISRNFYRMHGTYSEKTWSRYFGTMEEFRSEAKLQLNRHGRKLEKDIARHASLDEARRFFRLQIEPWVGKYEKFEKKQVRSGMVKMVVASDFHDVEVDLFALNVFIDTCQVEQPDIIVLNGDIFDMYEFSRFDRDPRKIMLISRFKFVHDEIFARLRAVCPNAQIDLIIGNHEHRILRHLAGSSPDILPLLELNGCTLAWLMGLDKFEINLVSKGDTAAFQPKEIRTEMEKNFKVYFKCLVCNHTGDENFGLTCISGHIHKPKMTTKVHVNTGPINNVVTGCMCKPDADYTIRKTDWQLGFAIAYIDANAERVQVNNVLFNDNFVNVNGRYYFRDSEDANLRDAALTAQGAIDAMKAKELQGFVNNDLETAEVAGLEKAKKAKAI